MSAPLTTHEAVRLLIDAALEEPQDSPLFDQADSDGRFDPQLRDGLTAFRALVDGTAALTECGYCGGLTSSTTKCTSCGIEP